MKLIFTFFIFLFFTKSFGQTIEKHHWRNRVLLILTNDIESTVFNKQIQSFKSRKKDMEERKLILYKVVSVENKIAKRDKNWIVDKEFFTTYKQTNKEFEVVLIGLDGGVKLRQTNYLIPEKLFAIIDGMPMRRSEIKFKNN